MWLGQRRLGLCGLGLGLWLGLWWLWLRLWQLGRLGRLSSLPFLFLFSFLFQEFFYFYFRMFHCIIIPALIDCVFLGTTNEHTQ
jgi:hypothetical protein